MTLSSQDLNTIFKMQKFMRIHEIQKYSQKKQFNISIQ